MTIQSVHVAGFPELMHYEPKCKLCMLTRENPGLLKVVHRKFREGLGSKALINTLRPVFEQQGVVIASVSAFERHLKGHIDYEAVSDPDEFDMPDPVAVVLDRLNDEEASMLASGPDAIAYGHNDSDYHNLAELFRRLVRRIVSLDEDPTAFLTDDGPNKQHNFQRLQIWSGMVANAKSIIEGLNKMRNSDRMTVSILENHTKRYATAVAGPLAAALRDIRVDLRQLAQHEPKAHALEVKLGMLLDHDVGELFTSAAARSLSETGQQYKLLN